MARTKGSKNKVKKAESAAEPITQPENTVDRTELHAKPMSIQDCDEAREKLGIPIAYPEEEPEIKDDTGPGEQEYVSLDEAARILGVNEACARLWFDHGHLTGINELGYIRISRRSLFDCKFRKLNR